LVNWEQFREPRALTRHDNDDDDDISIYATSCVWLLYAVGSMLFPEPLSPGRIGSQSETFPRHRVSLGWPNSTHRRATYFVKYLPEGRTCVYICRNGGLNYLEGRYLQTMNYTTSTVE
jgi:hypothetical protein